LAALAIVAAAAAAAGCGSNEPITTTRPPDPIQVAAKIDANRVAVSPNNFGAGVVILTVTNSSASPVRLALSGPKNAVTSEIKPGQPDSVQIALPEGRYRASAEGNPRVQAGSFTVASERPNSDSKLLLP
jgi:hypothetical protein